MIWLKYIVPLFLWTYCNSQNVCEEPPEIDFGEIVSDERAEHQIGDRVQYRCFPGYALEGPKWIICKGLEWTSAPKCLAPCTITKKQLEAKNLLLSGSKRHSLAIQNNQTLEFLCREGYILSTLSTGKCIDGHMNLPSCISEQGKNCSCPPTIENGDIITLCQIQYTSGSSVEFKCQRHYAMEGHSRSFCDNGNWTNTPVCLEIVCSRPEVNNGRVNPHREQYSHEQTIQIQCDSDYEPERQQATSQCTKTGWAPQPRCVSKRCNSPNTENIVVHGYRPEYIDHYFPKRERDYIYYQCKEGFLPASKQTWLWQRSTCTKTGWDPEPKCFKQCEHKEHFLHGNFIYGFWSKFIEGNEISFSCDKGYYPELQQAKAKCTKNGWSPTPRCIARDAERNCSRPPVIQNGDILNLVQASYPSGTTLQYKCQSFYIMNGSAEVRCEDGLWTKTPTCIEACTVSEEDMARNNIQLKWRDAPKLYSSSGGVVEFICRQNLQPDPSSPPFRTSCINGRMEYPRCIRDH